MELRNIAKNFVTSYFHINDEFFDTAWDFINANYDKIHEDIALGKSKIEKSIIPLSFVGETGNQAVKAVFIFATGFKEVNLTGDIAKNVLISVQDACKQYVAETRLTRRILEVIKSNQEKITNFFEEKQEVLTVKKKPEYEIWGPNKDYAGCTKLESLDREDLEKKFEELKRKYKLLVDDRYNALYVDRKKIDEIKIHRVDKKTEKVKYEQVVIKFAKYELLLWFLKNRDVLSNSEKLYRVGWSYVWENIEIMDLPDKYIESVKNEISILNAIFKAVGLEKHLKIESERRLGYRCIVHCDYCLILKSGHTP